MARLETTNMKPEKTLATLANTYPLHTHTHKMSVRVMHMRR